MISTRLRQQVKQARATASKVLNPIALQSLSGWSTLASSLLVEKPESMLSLLDFHPFESHPLEEGTHSTAGQQAATKKQDFAYRDVDSKNAESRNAKSNRKSDYGESFTRPPDHTGPKAGMRSQTITVNNSTAAETTDTIPVFDRLGALLNQIDRLSKDSTVQSRGSAPDSGVQKKKKQSLCAFLASVDNQSTAAEVTQNSQATTAWTLSALKAIQQLIESLDIAEADSESSKISSLGERANSRNTRVNRVPVFKVSARVSTRVLEALTDNFYAKENRGETKSPKVSGDTRSSGAAPMIRPLFRAERVTDASVSTRSQGLKIARQQHRDANKMSVAATPENNLSKKSGAKGLSSNAPPALITEYLLNKQSGAHTVDQVFPSRDLGRTETERVADALSDYLKEQASLHGVDLP